MTQEQVVINQRRSILIYAERQGISKACKTFNISRTTFYKIKKQLLETGSLAPKLRHKPKMPNEIALSKKKMLLQFVKKYPSRGPSYYAYEFRKQGISICQSTVWHHLKRFGLNKRYQRLIYLEKLKQDNQPLTERNLKEIKRHSYKIKEGLWPGHIVALDTFYVGNIKGVGRIYQLSGLDLCSRFAWAKLYISKEQKNTVDFIEDTLIPKFYYNNVEIESILTDNGSEFVAAQVKQLVADYDINHHRIPKGKPVCNGYCERFQRTLYEEFYQCIFRTKFFDNLEQLQNALDEYLVYYNYERAHFGLSKNGEVPINILKEKSSFLRQRFQKL